MASGYAGRVVYGESQALDTQRLQIGDFLQHSPCGEYTKPTPFELYRKGMANTAGAW
jgi:hypothetical protein